MGDETPDNWGPEHRENEAGAVEDLVRHLRSGREWALEILVDQFGPRLHAHARQYGDWHEAEDIVQEAFVYLWNKRLELDPGGNIGGLLCKVITNKGLNRARKSGRVELHEPDWFGSVPFEPCERGANGGLDFWALVERLLPAEQWNMVNLRWKYRCSLPQLAARTGLPIWRLKRLLLGALNTLKKSEEICSIRPL